MKEHPILFSGPMVRAILDGRKTMTRRVITKAKLVPVSDGISRHFIRFCPYGQPGDRLWVRETWMPETEQGCPTGAAIYRVTDNPIPDEDERGAFPLKWKPSIFMPRWASRITLEITAVRVERVQDISEQDAKAEGCGGYVGGEGPVNECVLAVEPGYLHQRFFRDGFRFLWDRLNAKRGYGWDANPWVWVISFKRIP